MWKFLAVLTFAAATVCSFASQATPFGTPKDGVTKSDSSKHGKKQTGSNNGHESTPPTLSPNQVQILSQPDEAIKEQARENIDIQRKIEGFTGVLAVVGVLQSIIFIGTLVMIKRQASHMETSERSWIVVHLEGERIPPEIQGDTGIKWTPFEIRIVNKGKTPAYLIESGHQGVILPRDRPLPDVPGPYEDFGVVKAIEKWGGEGLPLQPNADIIKPSLGAWCKDAGKLQRGFDVLWVYGYVIYRDAFQKRRETHYCVRWNSGAATDHGSSWDQGGPLGYNRAT